MGHTVLATAICWWLSFGHGKKFLTPEAIEWKEVFDGLFTQARLRDWAGVYMSHPVPLYTIFFSIPSETREKGLPQIQVKLKTTS